MLKIRLTRIGKRNSPQYRIVVMPARSKRDGKAIEYIGYYNPISKKLKLDVERAKYWISVGAKPTETVKSFLVKKKIVKAGFQPKRQPKKPKKAPKEEKEPKKIEKKKTDIIKGDIKKKKKDKETQKTTKKRIKKEQKSLDKKRSKVSKKK